MEIITMAGLSLALIYLIHRFFAEVGSYFRCDCDEEETGAPDGADFPDAYTCAREEITVSSCEQT